MREQKYDTLKGILIFLVVFAHTLITFDYYPNSNYNYIINSIYIFHMPLFFIIAGYFSKKAKIEKIINYIAIFLFMNTSFFLFDYLKYGNFDLFTIKYSSWFIILLAIYRLLIYNDKISDIILKKYSLIIIFFISIISGFIFKNIFLVRIFSFFYFFVFGYRKNFKTNKKHNCYLLITIATIIFVPIIMLNPPLDFLMVGNYNTFLESIIRTLIFIADTHLFIGIIGLIKNKEFPIINSLGKNSLYIYVFHRIPTLVLGYLFYPCDNYLLIALIISILLCLLINYLAKYLKILLQTKILIPVSFILILIPVIFNNINHELNVSMQEKI